MMVRKRQKISHTKWHDFSLLNLPKAILAHVIHFTSIQQWAVCSQVCKAMNEATRLHSSQCPTADVSSRRQMDWSKWPHVQFLKIHVSECHDASLSHLTRLTRLYVGLYNESFMAPVLSFESFVHSTRLRRLEVFQSRIRFVDSTQFPELEHLVVPCKLQGDHRLPEFIQQHPGLKTLHLHLDIHDKMDVTNDLRSLEEFKLWTLHQRRYDSAKTRKVDISKLPTTLTALALPTEIAFDTGTFTSLWRFSNLVKLELPPVKTSVLSQLGNLNRLRSLDIRLDPSCPNEQLKTIASLRQLKHIRVLHDFDRRHKVKPSMAKEMLHLVTMKTSVQRPPTHHMHPFQLAYCYESCFRKQIRIFYAQYAPALCNTLWKTDAIRVIEEYADRVPLGGTNWAAYHTCGLYHEEMWKQGLRVQLLSGMSEVWDLHNRTLSEWSVIMDKLLLWYG